jgi:membrane-associated PAP2 superfamily phosphatase
LIGVVTNLLFVANIKKFTNIRCPNQIIDFNGNFIYNKVFDPDFSRYNKKGQCFPAGHAVTAFCLMMTYYIFNQKFIKIMLLTISVISGWIIGIYQIAKGAHFFGDTLISMLLCGLVANLVAKYFILFYLKKNIKICTIFIPK